MARTDPDVSTSEPVSTQEAFCRLDDRAFVELVSDLWDRGRWTIESVHDHGTWYVDLSLHNNWPVERSALARLKLPESDKEVSGTDIRHFVRVVQREEVDKGILVVPTAAPESARRRAAKFNVDVVDSAELARQVDRWDARDLLTEHDVYPVDPRGEPLVARVPEPVRRVLERFEAVERFGRTLDGCLPSDPTEEDIAELTFTGFRIAMVFAGVSFLLAVVATSGSLLFWLLLGMFLFATYVVLLPLMATDIYVVRRFEETEWTPSWWTLASFVLAPVLFVVGTLYWYRRSTRTPSGQHAAWRPIAGSGET